MFELRFTTPKSWTEPVLADFDRFLQDHAAAEKKAPGSWAFARPRLRQDAPCGGAG